ncbi:hypothetical protein [Sphingobacterium alkalisoli]|nr:hypothetical protein [Sphingobacterium alkalisoli]
MENISNNTDKMTNKVPGLSVRMTTEETLDALYSYNGELSTRVPRSAV